MPEQAVGPGPGWHLHKGISLGQIVQLCVLAAGLIAGYVQLSAAVDSIGRAEREHYAALTRVVERMDQRLHTVEMALARIQGQILEER